MKETDKVNSADTQGIETVNHSDIAVNDSKTENVDSDLTVDDTVNHSSNSSTADSDKSTDKPIRHGMENLIPFTALTEEEQRTIASKGGKASGEARRKKKHMREIAQALLAHDMSEDQIEDVLGTAKDLLDGDKSVAAVLIARMVQEAAQGNYKAFETLRDTAGYKPKDEVAVEGITDADRALLARIESRQKSG